MQLDARFARRTLAITYAALVVATSGAARAEPAGDRSIGVHGIAGTDVTLGLGVGVGASVLVSVGPRTVEVGGDFLFSRSTYTDDEGIHEYTETTELAILAVRANALFGYRGRGSTFWIVGSGVAALAMDWEERSPTDTSLGAMLPDGGSRQEESGTVGAAIANFGVGRIFGSGLEVRAELPIFVFFNAVGGASSVAPTVAVSGGYRF